MDYKSKVEQLIVTGFKCDDITSFEKTKTVIELSRNEIDNYVNKFIETHNSIEMSEENLLERMIKNRMI